ncbi:peptidyl-prolyl cis-trans isomerase A (cyclophilin A) [Malonomonas rubra DSM 5091]|uniref:Peptidyl-prolyl cis-trans isomerase n=1 Tax=Malonomonas rubra DSM 5091 TaxID=1122189 RepID=A0A1M6JTJ5_MALRU|nr:peptidylprolyl isomerase [Malonomonas rubra]SHJ49999.1 peptidyl-prolyl cis-trans isomerase A (cyclophilin A) [Malonomonas rubra DSM 5091]
MKKVILTAIVLVFICSVVQAGTLVEVKTNQGVIKFELEDEKAPVTVKNFLSYVDEKFYDGTIFHRVIDGFMIQGGGFDQFPRRKQTKAAIKNEADNGLLNAKGTIAMARTGVIDSATSQFFINLVDNKFLNHRGKTGNTYGYAVFGKVVEGMDVVEKIGKVRTIVKSPAFRDYPERQVIIESVRRID